MRPGTRQRQAVVGRGEAGRGAAAGEAGNKCTQIVSEVVVPAAGIISRKYKWRNKNVVIF